MFNGDKANGASQVWGAAATTNWYRFVADLDLTNGTVALNIYDMGAAQPTPATSTPATPVAVFEGNRFVTDLQRPGDPDEKLDGISALGLAAFGVRGGGLYPANEAALIDNLTVSVRLKGTLLRVL